MTMIRRREFIAGTLATGAAAAQLKGAAPRVAFPTDPRQRLAVSTYSFRSVIASPHAKKDDHGNESSKPLMRLEEFAATVTKEVNIFGIEPWSEHFESTDPEYVHRLRLAFKKAGLRVVNIPVDVDVVLCGSADKRAQGLSVYQKWVDAAVILGSPSIRVHLPNGEKGQQIQCSVSSLSELAKYGESKNIVVNLENDDSATEQPERIARVINAVNSSYLRALPDFCNSMIIENDQSFNNDGLRKLFPLAFNISHAKSTESVEGRVLRVNVNDIFAIAKKAHYKGYFSIECEGTGDPYVETRELVAASVRSLS